MKYKTKIYGLIISILAIFALLVWADTETTTVTFVIPSEIDHSISYGGSCSSANFYFVENDGSLDGTQARINLTSDANPWTSEGASNTCQNSTVAGITITNSGSSVINVSMNTSTSLPSGTGLKAALADAGYEATCSGTATTSTCVDVIYGAAVQVAGDLSAQGGTEDVWVWANMSNFNSGVAGSDTETLQSHGYLSS